MDVVSEGELRRARAAGVPGDQIIFSGVGKTKAEMALGLDEKSCASTSNPNPNSKRCRRSPRRAAVAPIAIRVNPDVDARTHAKISTGKSENKFGVPISQAREVFARARELPGLAVTRRRHAYRFADRRSRAVRQRVRPARRLREALRADGHAIDHVDLGGGLGIPYRVNNEPPPSPEAYAEIVARHTRALGCQAAFEPGRLIVGNAGVLVDLGDLRQDRRAEDLRHRRCGNERPRSGRPCTTLITKSCPSGPRRRARRG